MIIIVFIFLTYLSIILNTKEVEKVALFNSVLASLLGAWKKLNTFSYIACFVSSLSPIFFLLEVKVLNSLMF